MKNVKLKQLILKVLKYDDRIWNENKTKLNQNLLLNLVDNFDEKIIDSLLQEDELRKNFFVKIKDVYVFKINDFHCFLKSNDDVILNWDHKDCILLGSKTKDENLDICFKYNKKNNKYEQKQSKKEDIFLDKNSESEQIQKLFDSKTFINWKRFDKDGEQEVKEIKRNLDGTIKENLIIKGENLIVLNSLKKQLVGKVKLIYIDPPYNTGNDGFKYNDNFNHSTWLTFMKNRIELAKKLLAPSGFFLVQCSFHQFAYLEVLMNDLFEKHLCNFNIQVRHPDRTLTGDKEFNDVIEYILIYSNDKSKKMPFVKEQKAIDEYSLKIVLKKNVVPEIIQCGSKSVEIYLPNQYNVVSIPPSKEGLKKISIRGSIREKNSSGRFFVKYIEKLNGYPPETLFKVPDMGDDFVNYRFFYSAPKGKKNGGYYQGMPTSSNITKKQFPNFFNFEKEYNNVSKQGDVLFRNGKKPEELLKFIIQIFTTSNDIVLDYYLGSGTTAAVAHKMGRQYIGIEQMDYIKSVAVERLKKVIDGEQGGISKEVNWKGGGDFIYFELAKWNETVKEKIFTCKSFEELLNFFDEIYEKYFLNYNFKIKEFREKVIQEKEFKALNLEEQKKMFIVMLDNNPIYVNKTEMEDKKFGINEKDQELTNLFYNDKE